MLSRVVQLVEEIAKWEAVSASGRQPMSCSGWQEAVLLASGSDVPRAHLPHCPAAEL